MIYRTYNRYDEVLSKVISHKGPFIAGVMDHPLTNSR